MKRRAILSALVLTVSLVIIGCGGGGGGGGGPVCEGSVGSPALIGSLSGTITHAGSVCSFGTSYYLFSMFSNATYTISLTNTQSDLSWALFSDPSFTITSLISICDFYQTPGPNDEICTVPLTGGVTYYLAVDEWDYVAGTFTLTIAP